MLDIKWYENEDFFVNQAQVMLAIAQGKRVLIHGDLFNVEVKRWRKLDILLGDYSTHEGYARIFAIGHSDRLPAVYKPITDQRSVASCLASAMTLSGSVQVIPIAEVGGMVWVAGSERRVDELRKSAIDHAERNHANQHTNTPTALNMQYNLMLHRRARIRVFWPGHEVNLYIGVNASDTLSVVLTSPAEIDFIFDNELLNWSDWDQLMRLMDKLTGGRMQKILNGTMVATVASVEEQGWPINAGPVSGSIFNYTYSDLLEEKN